LRSAVLDPTSLRALEAEIEREIDDAVAAMRRQPLVAPATALENVYAT
jgi:TPP-dependent pyruvate/acetoin dehydrogenase alpha subunit